MKTPRGPRLDHYRIHADRQQDAFIRLCSNGDSNACERNSMTNLRVQVSALIVHDQNPLVMTLGTLAI